MGASREITILALVEPTILLVAIFALSAPGSAPPTWPPSSPPPCTTRRASFSPASLLAAAALAIVVVAETGRLPVDNPSTHLDKFWFACWARNGSKR